MYDAWHEIVATDENKLGPDEITSDIVGPIFELGDFLAKDHKVPNFKQGDLVASLSAGACGAVLSSTYNSRRLMPEIIVHEDHFDIIRARPSFEELLALDSVPAWLGETSE